MFVPSSDSRHLLLILSGACIVMLAAAVAGCSCTPVASEFDAAPDTPAAELKKIPAFGGFSGMAFGMSPKQVRDKSPVAIAKCSAEQRQKWEAVFEGWDVSAWTCDNYPICDQKVGRVWFVFLDSRLAYIVAELGCVGKGRFFDWVNEIKSATGDTNKTLGKYGPQFSDNVGLYGTDRPHKPFSFWFAGAVLDLYTYFDQTQTMSLTEIRFLDPDVRDKWSFARSNVEEYRHVYCK
jgi:hypothetical protein